MFGRSTRTVIRQSALSRRGTKVNIRKFAYIPPLHHPWSPDNTRETHFDFTTENYKIVNTILAKYPENYKQSATLPLLDLAQRQNNNFLTLSAMNKVADLLAISRIIVYGVASFYTMFNREKVNKYFIQLCGTTPCQACGAEEIKKTIEEYLELHDGDEHSADGLFTLREVECLGACVNAPMVQINDDFYEQLTPETTIELLEACKKGKPPVMSKWGSLSMTGQLSCEGPMGKTTLKSELPDFKKFMRPDDELKPPTSAPDYISPEDVKKAMIY